MGLFTCDLSSDMIVTHLLYKAALVIAVLRWVLCWAFNIRYRTILSSSSFSSNNTNFQETENPPFPSPPLSFSSSSAQILASGLLQTTFGEIKERLPKSCYWDTSCAVCLNQLKVEDEVRELRNCCHVFHRECIDRWVNHDNQNNSCPLCRAPLLTPFQSQNLSSCAMSQPSWAVERLLYLFGDDLL